MLYLFLFVYQWQPEINKKKKKKGGDKIQVGNGSIEIKNLSSWPPAFKYSKCTHVQNISNM